MKKQLKIHVRSTKEELKQQTPQSFKLIIEALEIMEQKVENISKKAENLLTLIATV